MSINDLDKLIEELLQEFKITIKDDGSYDPSLTTGLGVGLKAFKPQNKKGVEQFAALAPETDEIDIKDFDKAFHKDTDAKFKTVAQNVLKNTRKADVFTAISSLDKKKHGISAKDLKQTPGFKAAQKLKKAEKEKLAAQRAREEKRLADERAKQAKTQAREQQILNKKVGEYNELLQNAKTYNLNLTELEDAVLQSYSSDNIQKITKWIATNKPKVDDAKTAYTTVQKQKKAKQQAKKQYQETLNTIKFTSDSINARFSSVDTTDSISMKLLNFLLQADEAYFNNLNWERWSKLTSPVSSANTFLNTVGKTLTSSSNEDLKQKAKLLSFFYLVPLLNKTNYNKIPNIEDAHKDELIKYVLKEKASALFVGKLKPISLKDAGLKIKELETSDTISKDVFSNMSVDNLNISDESKNVVSMTLRDVFSSFGIIKENLLKEISTEDVYALKTEDIFTLIKNSTKSPEDIKKALKSSYSFINADPRFDDKEDEKKEVLTFLSNLIKATEYYASGRQVRTKRGATTGWKVGTAQASGTARVDDQVKNMMIKAGGSNPNTSLKQKLINYSKFLESVNKSLKETGDFDRSKDISTLFSQFVGLEILNDNFFQTEEPGAKGFMFEAFLALIAGGKQVGGDLGGSDYVYNVGNKEVLGSSKLINGTEFEQAQSNLKDPMEYVIAIKHKLTETGQVVPAGKDDKIAFVKIYIVYSGPITKDPTTDEVIAPSIGVKPNDPTVQGKLTKKDVKFDMGSLVNKGAFVCDFDFSFLQETEFSDVSTKIMNKINAQVELAFSSLTNLRDNITKWVSEKDLIAANQVDYNQKDLQKAIIDMKQDKELKTSELSESIQQLDKLILEILQESLDK